MPNSVDPRKGGALALRAPLQAQSATSVFGDSIMAYGCNNTATTYPGYYSNGPITWINDQLSLAGSGLDVVGFHATPGTSVEDLIATQIPAALSDLSVGTGIAWVHSGVNDFNPNAGSGYNDTLVALLAQIKTALIMLSNSWAVVIWEGINPVNQAGSTGAAPRAYEFTIMNAMVKALCAQFSNVIFVNHYPVLVDPASTSLNPLANVIRTDDGIHYQSYGAQIAGYNWVNTVAPLLQITKYKTPGSNLLPAWSGTGGTATPNSGTITGTPPTGYNVALLTTSAGVTLAITSLAPDMIKYTITNAGSGATVVRTTLTSTTAILAAAAAGATIQAGFGFQAYSMTSLQRIAATLQFNGGTPIIYGGGEDDTDEPTIIYPPNAFSGNRQTPPYTVPSTQSSLALNMDIKVAGGGSAVVCIFNPFFYTLS